jgi:hypothetical protein
MQINHDNWNQWAQYLHQNKLSGFFRFLLEATGPIKIIAAQSLYMSRPFFHNPIISHLAEILEDTEKSKEFLQYVNKKEIDE